MKSYSMFNFDMLFSDHMAKVSDQAKLYYIKLCFFANNGFVANPISVLDSMGYDKSVYHELVANGELLTLPDRCEVFITSYFVHNHLKPGSWLKTPFAIYWKGKLFTKKNGVATFKPQGEEKEETFADQLEKLLPEQNQDETREPTAEELENMSDEEFRRRFLPY